MGRPKKYDEKGLDRAVRKYFDSISREVEVTERVDSGRRDDRGHVIYTERVVKNRLGKPIKVLEYLVPPTVGGLCESLGIHRSTWAEWCDSTKHPEFSDTTTHARGRMRAYLEQQLLTRKDVKGVIFDLQANYGYKAKQEIELGPRSAAAMSTASVPADQRGALLRELMEEFAREDAGGDG